jgi:hypothetical protein
MPHIDMKVITVPTGTVLATGKVMVVPAWQLGSRTIKLPDEVVVRPADAVLTLTPPKVLPDLLTKALVAI